MKVEVVSTPYKVPKVILLEHLLWAEEQGSVLGKMGFAVCCIEKLFIIVFLVLRL